MRQDTKSKEQRWDEATMWSLPKIETLRVIIPGVFGYRMDTPEGGNYWGAVGQQPGVPTSRHPGSGVYGGVLVVLPAIFALLRSIKGAGGPYSDRERKAIWFWGGVALVSLLLAYGRHAPLYDFYQLPYFSTIGIRSIRTPFHVAHNLFGYGLEVCFGSISRETSSIHRFGALARGGPACWDSNANGPGSPASPSFSDGCSVHPPPRLRSHLAKAGFPQIRRPHRVSVIRKSGGSPYA